MNSHRDARLERLQATADTWFGAAGTNDESAAMIETAFLMAAADGKIAQSEYEQLVATIVYVTGDRVGSDRVRIVLDQLLEVLQLDGWDARVQAVAASITGYQSRRNAYRLAAGVSFIDGEIHPNEHRLFALLAEAFDIPVDEASRILTEVRDSLFGSQRNASDAAINLSPIRRRTTQY